MIKSISHKTKNYLLQQVVSDEVVNTQITFTISNLRQTILALRRHMVIGFWSNLIYSSIVILMMYTAGNKKLISYSLFLTTFLYVSLTYNFLCFFCKCFLIYYGNELTQNSHSFRNLKNNAKIILKSRVYRWAQALGSHLFYINFTQFVLSLAYLIFGFLNVAVFAGIFMSSFFLIRIGTNFHEIYDILKRDLDERDVSELMATLKNSNKSNNSIFEGDCPICLESLKDNGEVLCLPCWNDHAFHFECLIGWVTKKPFCPLCKVMIE